MSSKTTYVTGTNFDYKEIEATLANLPGVLHDRKLLPDLERSAPRASNLDAQSERRVRVLSGERTFPRLFVRRITGGRHHARVRTTPLTFLLPFPPELLLKDLVDGAYSERGGVSNRCPGSIFFCFPPPGGCRAENTEDNLCLNKKRGDYGNINPFTYTVHTNHNRRPSARSRGGLSTLMDLLVPHQQLFAESIGLDAAYCPGS